MELGRTYASGGIQLPDIQRSRVVAQDARQAGALAESCGFDQRIFHGLFVSRTRPLAVWLIILDQSLSLGVAVDLPNPIPDCSRPEPGRDVPATGIVAVDSHPSNDAGRDPFDEVTNSRRMVQAKLLGKHTHRTQSGNLHIFFRSRRYIVRGRKIKCAFGETLPKPKSAAEARLAEIIAECNAGTFLTPTEARLRPIKCGTPSKITLRQLFAEALVRTRANNGKRTAGDYQSRVEHVLAFAEQDQIRSRWPWAIDIDANDEFALGLRSFLLSRTTTRNGHPLSEPKRLSPRQIYNILGTVQNLLNLASNSSLNLLPRTFCNPFTRPIIGHRPRRDPLAPPALPMDIRVEVVKAMDLWQLCSLSWSLVFPCRPEELTGVLISDVDRTNREALFLSRWGGDDNNKGHMSFRVPYPPQFDAFVRWLADGRAEGPLLRRRTIVDGRRQPKLRVENLSELSRCFDELLRRCRPEEVQAIQDRKRKFRSLLTQLGAVSEDKLAGEFKTLLSIARPGLSVRFYDLRGSVTTDLRRAGIDEILRRYLTGHAQRNQIMLDYESIDLHGEMQKYFQHIAPLLNVIEVRARELGLA